MKQRKGFTLAELLIVVAIIAVLVVISIPIFSSQLEKARDATSIANIRNAYAQAQTIALTEATSKNENPVYPEDKGNGVIATYMDGNLYSIVISNVQILSEKRNNWSGMGDQLPFHLFQNTDEIYNERDPNQGDVPPFNKTVSLYFIYHSGAEKEGTVPSSIPIGQLCGVIISQY